MNYVVLAFYSTADRSGDPQYPGSFSREMSGVGGV